MDDDIERGVVLSPSTQEAMRRMSLPPNEGGQNG